MNQENINNTELKQYLNYCIVLTIVSLSAIISLNLYIDPAHLFSSKKYEEGIADILLTKNNVINVSNNLDYRWVQKHYISNLSKSKDIIALGSSRAMQIRSNLFPDKSFHNHAIGAASLEDYLAIVELYFKKKLMPSTVILSLNPYLLNKSNLLFHWLSIKHEYFAMAERLKIDPSLHNKQVNQNINKIKELVSLGYLKESFKSFFTDKKDKGKYFATKASDSPGHMIFADGSYLMVDHKFRTLSINEVEFKAVEWGHFLSHTYNFTEFNGNNMRVLEAFVDFLQTNGTQVVFFLAPYHPTAYEGIKKANTTRSKVFLDVESYYRKLAKSKGIFVVGGYDPADSNCTREEFFDGAHPKESCMKKVFEYYAKNVANL